MISLHNHTHWSDGQGTPGDYLTAAERAGLEEVGVSDHYTLSPDGIGVEWSMPVERLPEYVADIRQAAESARVPLRLGIEADFFPETVQELDARLRAAPLDYVIGSVHFLDGFALDSFAADWAGLTQEEVDAKWRLYWARVAQMAQSRVFDIAAHLDLPKKFGFRPSIDLSRESAAALDAIAGARMVIEINTAGWSLPAREAYPAPHLLRMACEREIPLILSADAHQPGNVVRDFDRARTLALEAGYHETVRFHRRERRPAPL